MKPSCWCFATLHARHNSIETFHPIAGSDLSADGLYFIQVQNNIISFFIFTIWLVMPNDQSSKNRNQ